jgi:urease subunit alpha
VEGAEPTRYRPHWGGIPGAAATVATTFVSAAALTSPVLQARGRSLTAVRRTRGLTRADLAANRAAPDIAVDVRDGTVTLDGRTLAVAAVREVPLSRRYLLR